MSDENQTRRSAGSRGYEDDELTETIIASVIQVHQALGPGFIERIYQNAVAFELAQRGIGFEVEKRIMIYYSGHPMGIHRLDMVVADRVILETKAVSDFCAYDYARLRSYLKPRVVALGSSSISTKRRLNSAASSLRETQTCAGNRRVRPSNTKTKKMSRLMKGGDKEMTTR